MLKEKTIVKDYSPPFVSFIKHSLYNSDIKLFNEIYNNPNKNEKDFCFAVRFDKPKFTKDKILLNSENVIMTLSIFNSAEAIDFYNSFLKQKK